MTPETVSSLQLLLSGLNVLVIPALVGVGRWLMKVELRLARIEWANGSKPEGDR
jgi:hypothetical protein